MKISRTFFFQPTTEFGREELYRAKDMLRYDLAFISHKHPGIIAFPVFKTPRGVVGGVPTLARWRSFGITIARLVPTEEYKHGWYETGEEWFTERHPRDEDGRMIYSQLVPVTLKQFLEAKTIHEL